MISLKNTLEAIKTKLSAHDKALSVDYIVEQGTSGIWTYRKWNSGLVECYAIYRNTWSSWTGWQSGFYYNDAKITFPFYFTKIINLSATANNKEWALINMFSAESSSGTAQSGQEGNLYIARDQNATRTFNISLSIVGYIK